MLNSYMLMVVANAREYNINIMNINIFVINKLEVSKATISEFLDRTLGSTRLSLLHSELTTIIDCRGQFACQHGCHRVQMLWN